MRPAIKCSRRDGACLPLGAPFNSLSLSSSARQQPTAPSLLRVSLEASAEEAVAVCCTKKIQDAACGRVVWLWDRAANSTN